MARIKVPTQSEGSAIQIYNGDKLKQYLVKDGEIAVDDGHVESLLISIPGSSLVEEPVTKVAKPAKE